MLREGFSLDDRYLVQNGTIYLSGIQALVRLPFDQKRLDDSHGLRTAGFISGYRGSPLGGLDKSLVARADALAAADIVFQPGINEDLAATSVWGSQQTGLFPGARFDGVFGLWYGKAPGLDRSCDAVRHANAAGTAPQGGVVLVVGDDHACKSSTLPSSSQRTLQDLGIPILNPADVQDVLDFGLFGWALSRFSGCWSGLIALADTMDAAATIVVDPARHQYRRPSMAEVGMATDFDPHIRLQDAPLDQEARMADKLRLAAAFAAANGINRVVTRPSRARVAMVAAGKAYEDLRQALALLGMGEQSTLEALGIRVLKLGMTWPLDTRLVEQHCRGVERVVVVEAKGAFIEDQIRTILYGSDAPPIVGKHDIDGAPFLPTTGDLTVAAIAPALGRLFARLGLSVPDGDYLEALSAPVDPGRAAPAKQARKPLYCAGCPHNQSTKVPEGSRASAGIGCHYMAQWMDRETYTVTQMGGEGANWIGQAPFTDEGHIFVNLGDGTYFHSGILAIRAAVAAGVNVTFKVLFNDAVAMTGGQAIDGTLTVADLVAQLQAEHVNDIRVVTDDPGKHAGAQFTVHGREELDGVQRSLREVSGCSVLIYDQTCATELRRRRKRGLAVDPNVRVVINDAVCEGCGDCSEQSNCVAVEPLDTEFGLKRQINQTSCNKDLSCTDGFCPSFVKVVGEQRKPSMSAARPLALLAQPDHIPQDGDIVIAGVGGTGIVTLSQILGTAAHIEGKRASTLDMTGLAQKGGAVFGHVRIGDRGFRTRIPAHGADVLLAADVVTATSLDALELTDRRRTQAVVNTDIAPTADFVLSHGQDVDLAKLQGRLKRSVRRTLSIDAEHKVNTILGSAAGTNVFLLGFAFQNGLIPLRSNSIETAIRLNGVAVDANLAAFHYGRVAASDPGSLPQDNGNSGVDAAMYPQHSRTLVETIAARADFLVEYQDTALAQRYRALIDRVAAKEQSVRRGSERLTRAVAESYFRLLAAKDEYEVARLYTDGRFRAKLERDFEPGYRLVFSLAPSWLTLLNRVRRSKQRKLEVGGWIWPIFKGLAVARRIRGTIVDPFRWTHDRRSDRDLLDRFEADVERIVAGVTTRNLASAVEIVRLVQSIKGYGHIRAESVDQTRESEERLWQSFDDGATVRVCDPRREAA